MKQSKKYLFQQKFDIRYISAIYLLNSEDFN